MRRWICSWLGMPRIIEMLNLHSRELRQHRGRLDTLKAENLSLRMEVAQLRETAAGLASAAAKATKALEEGPPSKPQHEHVAPQAKALMPGVMDEPWARDVDWDLVAGSPRKN